MTSTWEVRRGDALALLRALPDEHAQCVVTSPPYWRLRDYGVDGQLGLEPTPEAYLAAQVEVFREVRRVLRRDGTCWVNMGDSYAAQGGGSDGVHGGLHGTRSRGRRLGRTRPKSGGLLKRKDLVGMPWRLALALQADGWYLRSEVIWHKTNASPESCADRPARDHEHLFLLARAPRYRFDRSALREPTTGRAFPTSWLTEPGARCSLNHNTGTRYDRLLRSRARQPKHAREGSFNGAVVALVAWRGARTVWALPTERGASKEHFAAYPRELVRRCLVLATQPGDLVLDPYAGTGTTGVVALQWGRSFLGLELSPRYAAAARRRLAQVQPLFAREATAS